MWGWCVLPEPGKKHPWWLWTETVPQALVLMRCRVVEGHFTPSCRMRERGSWTYMRFRWRHRLGLVQDGGVDGWGVGSDKMFLLDPQNEFLEDDTKWFQFHRFKVGSQDFVSVIFLRSGQATKSQVGCFFWFPFFEVKNKNNTSKHQPSQILSL